MWGFICDQKWSEMIISRLPPHAADPFLSGRKHGQVRWDASPRLRALTNLGCPQGPWTNFMGWPFLLGQRPTRARKRSAVCAHPNESSRQCGRRSQRTVGAYMWGGCCWMERKKGWKMKKWIFLRRHRQKLQIPSLNDSTKWTLGHLALCFKGAKSNCPY